MKPAFSTRRATLKDLSSLLEIERAAFPPERAASETTFATRLALPQAETWMAFLGDQPMGFSSGFPIRDLSTQKDLDPPDEVLSRKDGKVWLLRNVAVFPRFQKHGAGKSLVLQQVDAAREYGARAFRFTATENLSTFYSALGFRMIRQAENFHGVPQAVWELAFP